MTDIDDVKDCLIDCMTSFGIHGTSAAEAAEFILSPASGLSVTQRSGSSSSAGEQFLDEIFTLCRGCEGGFGYADNAHTRGEGCEFRAADGAQQSGSAEAGEQRD